MIIYIIHFDKKILSKVHKKDFKNVVLVKTEILNSIYLVAFIIYVYSLLFVIISNI